MTEAAFASRILLACAFLLAGATKAGQERATFRRIQAVFPLPDRVGRFVARALPRFEVGIAIFLALGAVSSFVGLVAAVSMVAFTVFLVAGRSRDAAFDCGCFGSDRGTVTWVSLARNVTLAGLGVVMLVAGPQPLSVDELLGDGVRRSLAGAEGVAVAIATTTLLAGILLVNEVFRARRSEAAG